MSEARPAKKVLFYRHKLAVRVTHWLNVVCLSFLLLSGLQIFNAHPELYWGHYGADADTPIISIGATQDDAGLHGVTRIGSLEIPTTGVLGVSSYNGVDKVRAFPSWLTVPSYRDLGAGRNFHFFFAWFFVINGFVYLAWSLIAGHFRRNLLPSADQLKPSHIAQEIKDHARLRFPKGEEAKRYNALQKLAYLGVIVAALPLMLLTGLTMSPGFNAIAPWLVDLFGGRQSARTIHFIIAGSLVAFVIVHLVMVLVSGLWNNIRSMITGYYAITPEEPAK